MAKKRRQPPVKPPRPSSDARVSAPWNKRVWILVSFIGAGMYGLLANGPTLLANAEKIPAEIERVSDRFFAWYYEDDAWEGLWSSNPEGYVDFEDMQLSADSDVRLHLLAEHGRIGGEISTKSTCQVVPMFDYLLLEGTISGDTATITAFDFIGGERKDFFQFTAKRDGVVILVALKEGAQEWLPTPIRIGLHPDREGEDPYDQLTGTCALEKEELMRSIRPKGLGR